MKTIPAAKSTVYRNNFKRHYLRKKRVFLIFYCIFEMCMKCRAFSKNYEYPSLMIFEIIDTKKRGNLHV